jgi:hypothetical protein
MDYIAYILTIRLTYIPAYKHSNFLFQFSRTLQYIQKKCIPLLNDDIFLSCRWSGDDIVMHRLKDFKSIRKYKLFVNLEKCF